MVLAIAITLVALLLFVFLSDIDSDSLNGYDEVFKYGTNPFSSDTDHDGLPDKWEIGFGFNPTNAQDALKDPDYDGLTDIQEYRLGTITKGGALSYEKDLFVEIDYMSGYAPSTEATNYFVSYYRELGIAVHLTVDDEVSNGQLAAMGISPESLTSSECSLIEQRFHDNPGTHVYVFYAKAVGNPSESEPLGWASESGLLSAKSWLMLMKD